LLNNFNKSDGAYNIKTPTRNNIVATITGTFLLDSVDFKYLPDNQNNKNPNNNINIGIRSNGNNLKLKPKKPRPI